MFNFPMNEILFFFSLFNLLKTQKLMQRVRLTATV